MIAVKTLLKIYCIRLYQRIIGIFASLPIKKIYLMQNSINSPVSEVISTYVYKMGVLNGNFSFSTAVGLFNSLVNLFMLLVVNTISKKLSNVSVL